MLFLTLSVVVPLCVWTLFPWLMRMLTAKRFERSGLLLAACVCFFISWHLPSPLIHGMNTQFTTHIVGGGVFSGLLWLYAKKQLHWTLSWPIEFLSVFATVSTLGVINELFEFVTVELHLTRLNGTDTWWDLLANTLGALAFWMTYRIALKLHVRKQ